MNKHKFYFPEGMTHTIAFICITRQHPFHYSTAQANSMWNLLWLLYKLGIKPK